MGVNNNGMLRKLNIYNFFSRYDDIGGATEATKVKATTPNSAMEINVASFPFFPSLFATFFIPSSLSWLVDFLYRDIL